MASTYNGSVANLVDPLTSSPLNSPSHAGQHTEINDALQTLGVWTSYTPQIVQPAALGITVAYAKYCVFNKTCIVNLTCDITSSGTAGSFVRIELPVATALAGGIRVGTGSVFDSSASAFYNCIASVSASTYVLLINDASAASAFGVTPNIALSNGDRVSLQVVYETI